jgi:thiamine-monophosphate kinase
MMNSGSEKQRPGEFELIAELFAPLATAPGAFKLTDDAAVITPPAGHDLIVTTDALVEGVHFFANDRPDLIAKKSLRVNLSDLAAKGSTPAGYLLVLSLPGRIDTDWLRSFAHGLAQDQREFGVSLLGGDTTATPGALTVAITAFGHVPAGKTIRRSGAQVGDLIYVTGTLGDAGAGLACLKEEGGSPSAADREYLVHRFQVPEPRMRLGAALIGLASSSLDVSDGLLADLDHMAETSAVRIEVEAARLPFSPALQHLWPDETQRMLQAATAGDDYEIAFTAPPHRREDIMQAAVDTGTTVSEIGRVVAGKRVALLDFKGHTIPVKRPGYVHF